MKRVWHTGKPRHPEEKFLVADVYIDSDGSVDTGIIISAYYDAETDTFSNPLTRDFARKGMYWAYASHFEKQIAKEMKK